MIKFSRREDYAIVIVSVLAQAYEKRLVPLSVIADEYAISSLFLRNIALELREAGVVKAVEGKNGGYYLTKNPKDVQMGEILRIFSDRQHVSCCTSNGKDDKRTCPQEKYCVAGNVWREINKEFIDKVYNMSLQSFLDYKPKGSR